MLSFQTNYHVLLLTTPRSYRLEAFRAAAERLGIAITTGMDLPPELAEQWPGVLSLDFREPEAAVRKIVEFEPVIPLAAILAVDDSGSLIAARASQVLQLPHNQPAAAAAARNKYLMRRILREGGVPTPWFRLVSFADDPAAVVNRVNFPCVVKPLDLNGSRGVIRANDPAELQAAIARLAGITGPGSANEEKHFLVEGYIPGIEVALEGILDHGVLHVLALFDKPDPLEGPFFEETIYVTPSRLPEETQSAIRAMATAGAKALGLSEGPVHAELRINDDGAWILELAGRSIGGLCSQILRFGVDASLEELILRQACGMGLGESSLSRPASGVMMIPIPEAGLLRQVSGIEDAEAIPFIERVEITARLNYPLVPLPEGDSYLGFIFARGDSPGEVEAALRAAHRCLKFEIDPLILLSPA